MVESLRGKVLEKEEKEDGQLWTPYNANMSMQGIKVKPREEIRFQWALPGKSPLLPMTKVVLFMDVKNSFFVHIIMHLKRFPCFPEPVFFSTQT